MPDSPQPLPDIPQPSGLSIVQAREDRRGQSRNSAGPPPKKIVETYQETVKAWPLDDRVTIIGIPIDQITPSTQAALAGLVAENARLRAQVRRLESSTSVARTLPPVLERDAFVGLLAEMLSGSPGASGTWILMLIHVLTYEDIRRSSGVLAANTALDDVGQRLRQLDFDVPVAANDDVAVPSGPPRASTALMLAGYLGGLTLGALFAAPSAADPSALARTVQERLTKDGYDVAGLAMALAVNAAAAVVGVGESGLLAIARVDHLSRAPH